MRKVRYISVGDSNITYGKIYDVVDYMKYINPNNDIITILNDHDDPGVYYSRDFIDATAEIRNEVIDGILK